MRTVYDLTYVIADVMKSKTSQKIKRHNQYFIPTKMAMYGLVNKEKLRKTNLSFGNDSPRKTSSYWRDYGPDTRIRVPLPAINHRPQTPVQVK